MSSPFPGVDPYIESLHLWPDFYARFINYWCEALSRQLPSNYRARIGERVRLIDLTQRQTKLNGPDVAVIANEPFGSSRGRAASTATLEPISIPHAVGEETRETYIEIVHREDKTLVGVLELLSPTNKVQPDFPVYLAKRNHLLHQYVHLFELDLLLGGQRLPHAKPLPPGNFYAFVSRADQRFICDVYSWGLRDPLPTLPIPLVGPDPDVMLDFANIFATTYERADYSHEIDYSSPPEMRLPPADREWIASLTSSKTD